MALPCELKIVPCQTIIEACVPVAHRLQMHLAGGFYHEGYGRYIDSHSRPIPDAVWHFAQAAMRLGQGKFDGIFIERDWDFPSTDGWRKELAAAQRMVGCASLELV